VHDKYLGQYVGKKIGLDLILWPGYCPTHVGDYGMNTGIAVNKHLQIVLNGSVYEHVGDGMIRSVKP